MVETLYPQLPLQKRTSPTGYFGLGNARLAFQDLKDSLCQEPILQSLDFDKTLTVQTDASEHGLGAVLLQVETGQLKPIAYISQKLLPHESNYSTVEKVYLAIKWELDSLRYYLLGRKFILETDHRALSWLGRMRDTNTRNTRWFLAIQPFDFEVLYRAGAQNCTVLKWRQEKEGEMSQTSTVTRIGLLQIPNTNTATQHFLHFAGICNINICKFVFILFVF